MFRLEYAPGWDEYFSKLDNSMQIRIHKKIKKIKVCFPVFGQKAAPEQKSHF